MDIDGARKGCPDVLTNWCEFVHKIRKSWNLFQAPMLASSAIISINVAKCDMSDNSVLRAMYARK